MMNLGLLLPLLIFLPACISMPATKQTESPMKVPITLLKLKPLKELQIERDGESSFVSSASGIVKVEESFYIIGDDEPGLGVFNGSGMGRFAKLDSKGGFSKLPKKAKFDFEAILYVPEVSSHGGLLAVPSGSKPNRVFGGYVSFLENGDLGDPLKINFQDLYEVLSETINELNIEGAVLTKDRLLMLQRGNGSSHQNAVITLNRAEFVNGLIKDNKITKACLSHVEMVNLGFVSGSPLGFTDGALLDENRMLFLAVAEASEDTYEDGAIKGSVIGIMDIRNYEISRLWKLDTLLKPEGVFVEKKEKFLRVIVVTDADDVNQPSQMLEVLIDNE
jgi:hypothetical protein